MRMTYVLLLVLLSGCASHGSRLESNALKIEINLVLQNRSNAVDGPACSPSVETQGGGTPNFDISPLDQEAADE